MTSIINFITSLFPNSPQSQTATKDYTSRSCRYKLEDTSSNTFTLPSGRKIGYAEFGAPRETALHTVFALHGLPGNRLEGALVHATAESRSIRVILPERPGYGLSDEFPNWTPLSHAQDVLSLADHLGIRKYGIIGTSGGGPYAMACAYLHPRDRLLSVTNLVGMGETASMSCEGMAWLHWLGYGPAGYMRFARMTSHWFVTGYFKAIEPGTRMWVSEEGRTRMACEEFDRAFDGGKLPEAETKCWERLGKEYVYDILRLMNWYAKEVWGTEKGCRAVTMDGANLASAWGFRVEDIRADLTVQLWYGEDDNWCPPTFGRQTLERLKRRGEAGEGERTARLRIEKETHMSIQIVWQEEIWKELVASMEAAEREY